jgi:membrane protein YqaA with SNARE-associated domain
MTLLYIFFFVFLFNLIPAFAPPTWILLSYIQVKFHPNVFVLALTGAAAATLGRIVLAKLAKVIVRDRFLSAATKRNIDTVKAKLHQHEGLTFSVFLLFAFSPFPSNQLFLAYGLTNLPLALVAAPFFLGRFVSYLFWIVTAHEISKRLAVDSLRSGAFFKTYFVVIQIVSLALVYVFIKIDWHKLFTEHKLGWIKK